MANKIQTLPEYLERLKCYEGQTVVFRGTDCRWKMLPAITRSFCHRRAMRNDVDFDGKVIASEWFQDGPPAEAKEELEEYESMIFDSFRRQARSYLASQPSSPWEWLALAPHNELPTRLLDWSKNPLAAAYFAVAGSSPDPEADGYVYVLEFGGLEEGHKHMIDLDDPPKDSPLEYEKEDGVDRFIPPVIDPRIAAQQGVFTVSHPLPRITEAVATRITCITLAGSKRLEFRRELHRFGVNGATLFPDLVSFCRNQQWVWEEYRANMSAKAASHDDTAT